MTEVIAQIPTPIPSASQKPKPILSESLRPWSPTELPFCPSEHLSYTDPPPLTLSLADVGLSPSIGISPVAISEPFPLFTPSAIRNMRTELLTHEVFENCMYSTPFAGCQIRGYAPKYAPFTYEAWTHPATLRIISTIAGVELVPAIDIEVSNINISTPDFGDGAQAGADLPVTKWHYDSYPFVCVVMMSDAATMRGGETAIRKANGEVLKVRGPQMGCAIVLQGRVINHQALAAFGGAERITAVTAFRPKDPMMLDSSVLTTIRPITEHSELYYQWTEYRVLVLQERLSLMLKELREQHRAGNQTDKARIKEFLRIQEEWLQVTDDEII